MSKRTIYAQGPCGCSMPGIVALMKREQFDQAAAAQGLRKGRRAPAVTGVGRYVESKHPAVKRKVLKALKALREAIKPGILKAYGKFTKADDKRKTVQQIIDQLDSADMGIDLTGELEGPMTAAFRRAAALGATQLGFENDRSIVKQMDVKAREYAAARSSELIKDLGGTTLDDMRALVTRGVEEGMSTDDLAAAIDAMGAFGDARAETIARTELAYAHVQGNVAGWKSTGEEVLKESILGDLHDIEDICDECADAGPVDLDEEFVDGYSEPPYHPNCICDIKPSLKPEDE